MSLNRQEDQAEVLRRRAAKKGIDTKSSKDVDVFSLPSRKEIHKRKTKKKAKHKQKYSVAQILLVLFILIVLTAVLTPFWINWF